MAAKFVSILATLAIVLVVQDSIFVSASTEIDPSVLSELSKNPSVAIILTMKVGTATVLQKLRSVKEGQTRAERIENVASTLELLAKESQKNILAFLKKTDATYTSFWISNQIFVKSANEALVQSLANMNEVGRIQLDEIFLLDEPSVPGQKVSNTEIQWGIQNIQAPQVWAHEKGNSGEEIVVGIIDSGVRWTHTILIDNYVHDDYGWYDPYDFSPLPNDQNGHGTHVAGTIVGKAGIGVAPMAQWMACKGCADRTCHSAALIACGQFMLRPTHSDGTRPDASKAPNVINNSWGGAGGRDIYAPVIEAWQTAGIIPVFAIGNDGPQCHTAGSPGDLSKVIAVGATTPQNGLADFSSRGPSAFGPIKPDISAPGFNIFSAGIISDDSGVYKNGTSMASPHVTGVVALLLSNQQTLTFEQVESYLYAGVDKNVEMNGQMCGGVPDTQFPNNFYGHGKVDALRSFEKLLQNKGGSNANVLKCSGFTSVIIMLMALLLQTCRLKLLN